MPLTAEQIAVEKDESIDFSDIPELNEEFWERAQVAKPNRTDQIAMRVKRSVVACFEAPEMGYQTRNEPGLDSYVWHITKQSTNTWRRRGPLTGIPGSARHPR